MKHKKKAFSSRIYKSSEKNINFDSQLRKTKMATMWLKISPWHLKTHFNTKDKNNSYLINSVHKQLSTGNTHNISILTSHRYIEIIDEINNFHIDAGTFGRIRTNALQQIQEYSNNTREYSDEYKLYYEWKKINRIGKLSKIANMMPFGLGIQIDPYFSKWDVKKKK